MVSIVSIVFVSLFQCHPKPYQGKCPIWRISVGTHGEACKAWPSFPGPARPMPLFDPLWSSLVCDMLHFGLWHAPFTKVMLCDCDILWHCDALSSLSRSANFQRKDRRPNLLKSRKQCKIPQVKAWFYIVWHEATHQGTLRISTSKRSGSGSEDCHEGPGALDKLVLWCAVPLFKTGKAHSSARLWFEAQNWSYEAYEAFAPRPNLPFPWPLQHPRRLTHSLSLLAA